MGKKVLVVDDERLIVKGIKFSLVQDDMEVDCAYDGEEALEMAKKTEYDIVLLDVMLPKMDGFEVCQRIREFSNMPIIMLTAKGDDMDKILGLEYGADDYITKPFSPVVLQKKIAVLTKYITEKQKETVYEDGNLCINFSQMTATLDKVPLELSPLEYRILQYFIVNKKHILKRDQLLEHLWDFSENFVGDTSLNTAISRLRKKIEASGHRYIKTIYGTGYMWIGD